MAAGRVRLREPGACVLLGRGRGGLGGVGRVVAIEGLADGVGLHSGLHLLGGVHHLLEEAFEFGESGAVGFHQHVGARLDGATLGGLRDHPWCVGGEQRVLLESDVEPDPSDPAEGALEPRTPPTVFGTAVGAHQADLLDQLVEGPVGEPRTGGGVQEARGLRAVELRSGDERGGLGANGDHDDSLGVPVIG